MYVYIHISIYTYTHIYVCIFWDMGNICSGPGGARRALAGEPACAGGPNDKPPGCTKPLDSESVCAYINVYTYLYIHIDIHIYICVYIYMYIII